MNNIKTRNKLFTLLLLVMALLIPQWGWAQTASKPQKGDGKTDNPFIITKAEELAWFRDYVNGTIVDEDEAAGTTHPSVSAMLTANIDLKGYCYKADKTQSLNELSWVPIGNINNAYKGTFDGNGKTISNLYINASQENMGLFGYILDSTIKNLTLEDANVTNMSNYTGILVGKTFAENTLQNIKISGTCEVNGGDYTGGIAGEHGGKAYNCVNHATVQGTETVGGLFGRYYSGNFVTSITACANYGKVNGNKNKCRWLGWP